MKSLEGNCPWCGEWTSYVMVQSHYQCPRCKNSVADCCDGETAQPDGKEQIRKLFNGMQWRFAKTMPQVPHWYTRRGDWESEKDFEWAVKYLNKNGGKERFRGKEYRYFHLDGFKYWTMGALGDKAILINRAKE